MSGHIVAAVIREAKAGLTPAAIAVAYSVKPATVRKWLFTARKTDKTVPKFQPRTCPARTDAEIEAVVERRANGMKYRDIAAELNIPFGTVATIMRRWRIARNPAGSDSGPPHE